MNKKIVLLNPLASLGDGHVHFARDCCGGEPPASLTYPPLDLAYAASLLMKHHIDVEIIDANVLHITHSEVVKIVKEKKPDFVEIPSSWGSLSDDMSLSKIIKETIPSTKIIISGPNVTYNPQIALDSDLIDYVILGELEQPLLDIAKGCINTNIAYKDKSNILIKNRVLNKDLDSLPFPARSLLPKNRYFSPFTKSNPFTTMLISRGCPWKCIFCPHELWDMGEVRFRSVANIMEEIEEILRAHQIKEIIFVDLTFTANQELVREICENIIKRDYTIHWRCFARVDTVSRDLLILMKKAGCHQICYGFESGSQKILELNEKGFGIDEIRKVVKLTRESDIEVAGTFMIGMYGDTNETIEDTIQLALALDLDYAQFNVTIPTPSTKLFNLLKSDKVDLSDTAIEYSMFRQAALNEFLKIAYKKFYFRKGYILKRFKRINNLTQLFLQFKMACTLFKNLL